MIVCEYHIGFEFREDAEITLEHLKNLIKTYGQATVQDMKDCIGATPNPGDNKYGWRDIDNAGVRAFKNDPEHSFYLVLPDPTNLN